MWLYQQSTGVLRHDGQYVATGYAGHGDGLNNPAFERIRGIGPLPAGVWKIGKAYKHDTLGPVCMNLKPVGHFAFNRKYFRIHGDNSRGDKSASHGCIILPRVVRERISNSGDDDLTVVA